MKPTTMPSSFTLHPLDPLSADEIRRASSAIRSHLGAEKFGDVGGDGDDPSSMRFMSVSLSEPPKSDLIAYDAAAATGGGGGGSTPKRRAEAVVLDPTTGIASEVLVDLHLRTCTDGDGGAAAAAKDAVISVRDLPPGVQPMFSPECCDLAESTVQSDAGVASALRERYGIEDMKRVACDPWSVHFADEDDASLADKGRAGQKARLVQTFLYHRKDGTDGGLEGNHYAHPIDLLPVVDLNSRRVVSVSGLDRKPPPTVPDKSVNYHRDLLHTNAYLRSAWREERLSTLNVVQPDGPSFDVDGNAVAWQKWSFRVGFNYREGLVLHDVKYGGRSIVHRASLVEMAVPYADPHPPYQRKCAFDVGDYGLGYCANSLELGCDCLGHIHYFDAIMSNAKGDPVVKKAAVCMHEEDGGILWKHVEYRNGHSESRRSRELVLSFIATVVNYEYLFYWRLKQDGTIHLDVKLSGELSTNLLSQEEEEGGTPGYGTIVAPGVNAQIHQHMFCARLDMAVDGHRNTVSEVDIVPQPPGGPANPYGNVFRPSETVLKTEKSAIRTHDATKARCWRVSNASEEGAKTNPVNGKPVSYKLYPFTSGTAQPPLLVNHETCAVASRGAFATAHLWVTPHDDRERFPAGEYTPQGDGGVADGSGGLARWTSGDRNVEGADVVLWHAFGVAHVPRVEDFPVMPCEITGFALKPDGFFDGNPAVDLRPERNDASRSADGGYCNGV